MSIIQEYSEKHKIAWSDFVVWINQLENRQSALLAGFNYTNNPLYQLTGIQAWLDSVGIYCEAMITQGGSYKAYYKYNTRWKCLGKEPFQTRPEALKSAIDKGLEIYENNKNK